ncbi:MAG: ATP synthase F1 subunit delta [Faecalicatena sp.]|uniref:ATP synthase F1 subunit delta n=1 Tax=Faecalicatena sp. TaxID=2005360 RepID=UPI0025856E7E|nr:ATP synthase F1 subunit delta [Faecalicatena sp.]MCI6467583.1 ATP synthase F1 subunit delta [Faecalicatena sp.]MDY5619759.1 ATP synthase F1 subunit delta [Lachnospiraceae bacterium]
MMTQTDTNSQYCPQAAVKYTQRASRNTCPYGQVGSISCSTRYAKVLYELNISNEAIQKTRDIFTEVPQLHDVFVNPTIQTDQKQRVIDQVFPEEIRNFLKVACRYQRMDLMDDIFAAYDRYCDEQEHILNAVLTCVEPPSEVQLKEMKAFLCKKYDAVKADIEIRTNQTLLGGFVLHAGSDEYDWSLKGRLNRLEQKLTWR